MYKKIYKKHVFMTFGMTIDTGRRKSSSGAGR